MSEWSLTTNLVLFLLLMHATVPFLGAAGVWDDWGVDVASPVGEEVSDINDSFDDIRSGKADGQTLLTVFADTASLFVGVFGALFALPTFLMALGVPAFGVALIEAPLVFVVGRKLAQLVRGQ